MEGQGLGPLKEEWQRLRKSARPGEDQGEQNSMTQVLGLRVSRWYSGGRLLPARIKLPQELAFV